LLPSVIWSPGPDLTPIKAKTHYMSRPHPHLRSHPHMRPYPHLELRLHPHLYGEQVSREHLSGYLEFNSISRISTNKK